MKIVVQTLQKKNVSSYSQNVKITNLKKINVKNITKTIKITKDFNLKTQKEAKITVFLRNGPNL